MHLFNVYDGKHIGHGQHISRMVQAKGLRKELTSCTHGAEQDMLRRGRLLHLLDARFLCEL